MSKKQEPELCDPEVPQSTEARGTGALDAIKQLQRLVDEMAPEQREQLSGIGINVPRGDVGSALQGRFKFGVRCTHCNQIALYFVGDQWELEGGEVVDFPPPLPHNRILWTQKLPPHEIDRGSPKCQHCGVPVALEGSGSFRRNRGRIVEVQLWQQSRDQSFDRKELAKMRRKQAGGDSAMVDVSHDYNVTNRNASKVIAEQRGDAAVQELAFLAKATGIEEALKNQGRAQ